MIADINIGLSFSEIFTPVKIITDKCEHTENPRPHLEKPTSDPTHFSANHEGKDKAGKEDDHKNREDEKYPEGIELKQDPFN